MNKPIIKVSVAQDAPLILATDLFNTRPPRTLDQKNRYQHLQSPGEWFNAVVVIGAVLPPFYGVLSTFLRWPTSSLYIITSASPWEFAGSFDLRNLPIHSLVDCIHDRPGSHSNLNDRKPRKETFLK